MERGGVHTKPRSLTLSLDCVFRIRRTRKRHRLTKRSENRRQGVIGGARSELLRDPGERGTRAGGIGAQRARELWSRAKHSTIHPAGYSFLIVGKKEEPFRLSVRWAVGCRIHTQPKGAVAPHESIARVVLQSNSLNGRRGHLSTPSREMPLPRLSISNC